MKQKKDLHLVILIDGDNTSFERMEDIMHYASRYGNAIVKRIYGDWTKKSLAGWKDATKEHSFKLIQATSFVSGKNTTDIALCIDAMDILSGGLVNCFCPVGSDSDYTLLAQRFCEAGLAVL